MPAETVFPSMYTQGARKAVIYTTGGLIKIVDEPASLSEIYAALKCERIEMIPFMGELEIYMDEMGRYNSTRNTRFADEFGHLPNRYGGAGVYGDLHGNLLIVRSEASRSPDFARLTEERANIANLVAKYERDVRALTSGIEDE